MKSFAPALVECLRAEVGELARAALERSQQDGDAHRYTLQEYTQIIGAFVGLIEEASYERPPERFAVFQSTIVPALIRAGVDPTAQTKRLCASCVHVATVAARDLPRDVSIEASLWLSSFIGDFVAQMSKSVHEAAGGLRR